MNDIVVDTTLRQQEFIHGTFAHEGTKFRFRRLKDIGFLHRSKGIPDLRLWNIAKAKNKQLVLCGHSLGGIFIGCLPFVSARRILTPRSSGAVAQLVTFRILAAVAGEPAAVPIPSERLLCMTFGSPCVGGQELQYLATLNHWHKVLDSYLQRVALSVCSISDTM